MTYSPLLAPTRPYNVLVNRPLASAYISATTHITAQVCPLASSRLFGALDAKDDDDQDCFISKIHHTIYVCLRSVSR